MSYLNDATKEKKKLRNIPGHSSTSSESAPRGSRSPTRLVSQDSTGSSTDETGRSSTSHPLDKRLSRNRQYSKTDGDIAEKSHSGTSFKDFAAQRTRSSSRSRPVEFPSLLNSRESSSKSLSCPEGGAFSLSEFDAGITSLDKNSDSFDVVRECHIYEMLGNERIEYDPPLLSKETYVEILANITTYQEDWYLQLFPSVADLDHNFPSTTCQYFKQILPIHSDFRQIVNVIFMIVNGLQDEERQKAHSKSFGLIQDYLKEFNPNVLFQESIFPIQQELSINDLEMITSLKDDTTKMLDNANLFFTSKSSPYSELNVNFRLCYDAMMCFLQTLDMINKFYLNKALDNKMEGLMSVFQVYLLSMTMIFLSDILAITLSMKFNVFEEEIYGSIIEYNEEDIVWYKIADTLKNLYHTSVDLELLQTKSVKVWLSTLGRMEVYFHELWGQKDYRLREPFNIRIKVLLRATTIVHREFETIQRRVMSRSQDINMLTTSEALQVIKEHFEYSFGDIKLKLSHKL